jgi:hypothetical protein
MKEKYIQTMFEQVQAYNKINKLTNKLKMCDKEFVRKMI